MKLLTRLGYGDTSLDMTWSLEKIIKFTTSARTVFQFQSTIVTYLARCSNKADSFDSVTYINTANENFLVRYPVRW